MNIGTNPNKYNNRCGVTRRVQNAKYFTALSHALYVAPPPHCQSQSGQ